jgi:hypothetical protein
MYLAILYLDERFDLAGRIWRRVSFDLLHRHSEHHRRRQECFHCRSLKFQDQVATYKKNDPTHADWIRTFPVAILLHHAHLAHRDLESLVCA